MKKIVRRLVTMGVAAALFLCPVAQVGAAAVPEEVLTETAPEMAPVEETVAETLPEETLGETLPSDTEETAGETLPVQTEETVPETEPAAMEEPLPEETEAAAQLYTVAQAWQLPVGTEGVAVCGSLVFLQGTNAVLQDETGGIRATFFEAPGLEPGTVVLATGTRSGGFQISGYEVVEVGELPFVEYFLINAPENLRVCIPNAKVNRYSLTQGGFTMSLFEEIPAHISAGSQADVYGVILDGIFYADRFVPRKTEASVPEQPEQWNHYFGLLHAHTDISDGEGTVEEAFQYAAGVEGLDFFAVTDHSNSFDNAEEGSIRDEGVFISEEWAAGKAAAEAVTDETFVGIFGYEMTWPEIDTIGHINTFNTPGWQTRDQAGMGTLEGYFAQLAHIPDSVSQFNHPSFFYGNFQNFRNYSAQADAVMHLLELGGVEPDMAYRAYVKALDEGWHLAPTLSQNNHYGSWGEESPVRTVVLAEKLTENSLYAAMRAHRTYATEDGDLYIDYRVNGHIMGSILGPGKTLTLTAVLQDPTDEVVGTVEVIGQGGELLWSQTVNEPSKELTVDLETGSSYYFLRITQPDGDVAVTAPVWVETYENIGIRSFSASEEYPEQGTETGVTVELYNEEAVALRVEKIELFAGETPVETVTDYGTVDTLERASHTFRYTGMELGQVTLLVKVTGTVAGEVRSWQASLTLNIQPKDTAVEADIRTVRQGNPGGVYRIRGYVTAGNENPYNSFSGLFYLQDDTGGIAVEGSVKEYLGIGTNMEVTGVLVAEEGNRKLVMTQYTLTEEYPWRYEGEEILDAEALDMDSNGGKLMQAQGQVLSTVPGKERHSLSRFTLRTENGTLVTVSIEEGIRSGAHGTNTLANTVRKGRTVRGVGLLHMDENGKTVLRVRNCDEILYIPTKADGSNPRTADWLARLLSWLRR